MPSIKENRSANICHVPSLSSGLKNNNPKPKILRTRNGNMLSILCDTTQAKHSALLIPVSFPRSIALTGSPPDPKDGVILLMNAPIIYNLNNLKKLISVLATNCHVFVNAKRFNKLNTRTSRMRGLFTFPIKEISFVGPIRLIKTVKIIAPMIIANKIFLLLNRSIISIQIGFILIIVIAVQEENIRTFVQIPYDC